MKLLYHGTWAEIKCSRCNHPCETVEIGETTTMGYQTFSDKDGWHVHDPNRVSVDARCWRCGPDPIAMSSRGFNYCECGWRSDKEGA